MLSFKGVKLFIKEDESVGLYIKEVNGTQLAKMGYVLASTLIKQGKMGHLGNFIKGMEVAMQNIEEITGEESDDSRC